MAVTPKPQRGRGRPTVYTEAIAAEICERIANGASLKSVCSDDAMPSEATVINWHLDDREGFSERYMRARAVQAMRWHDEVVEIADDGSNDWMAKNKGELVVDHEHVTRSRLRIDTRKWLMSVTVPRLFGAKEESSGSSVTVNIRKFGDE